MNRKIFFLLSFMNITLFVITACVPLIPKVDDSPAPFVLDITPSPMATITNEPKEVYVPKGSLKVLSYTNELRIMAIAYEGLYENVDVEYTMIPMTSGVQPMRECITTNKPDDCPDVIALEATFVKEWVESKYLRDISDLLPLAKEMQIYPFVIQVGQHESVSKAFSYQAAPGAFFYRRSIARECLGSDDPAKVQAMVTDMKIFVETAAKVVEYGTGDYYAVGTSSAMFSPFLANRTQPWIVDNTLVVDPMVNEFVDFAKMMRENGYEAQANQWGESWIASMSDSLVGDDGTQKKIFGYFLPTWGLPYVLMPNSINEESGTNTSGDWAMVEGPLPYLWGDTWIGVVDGSPNAELAKDFVRFVALDQENLINWATGVYTNDYLKAIDPETPDDLAQPAGDFVSSQVVVEKIAGDFNDSEETRWLGGQNYYEAFGNIAPKVNGTLMTGSDDAIQRALQSALEQYLNDEVTKKEMWDIWLDAVHNEFPDLIIPELPAEYMEE